MRPCYAPMNTFLLLMNVVSCIQHYGAVCQLSDGTLVSKYGCRTDMPTVPMVRTYQRARALDWSTSLVSRVVAVVETSHKVSSMWTVLQLDGRERWRNPAFSTAWLGNRRWRPPGYAVVRATGVKRLSVVAREEKMHHASSLVKYRRVLADGFVGLRRRAPRVLAVDYLHWEPRLAHVGAAREHHVNPVVIVLVCLPLALIECEERAIFAK